MPERLKLIVETADGQQREVDCSRLAVIWQGRELWIQDDGSGQLLIGVDTQESDSEYANLVLRPMATNLVGLQLEMEPIVTEDEHVHGDGCGCEH